MSSETRNYDELDFDDLRDAAMNADWSIVSEAGFSDGEGGMLTLQKRFTSENPAEESRTVGGTDRADAMRKFLKSLDGQGDGE